MQQVGKSSGKSAERHPAKVLIAAALDAKATLARLATAVAAVTAQHRRAPYGLMQRGVAVVHPAERMCGVVNGLIRKDLDMHGQHRAATVLLYATCMSWCARWHADPLLVRWCSLQEAAL